MQDVLNNKYAKVENKINKLKVFKIDLKKSIEESKKEK